MTNKQVADRCIEIVRERYQEWRQEFGPASDPWEYILDGLKAFKDSLDGSTGDNGDAD
jgi:hypothetical protein